MLDVNYPLRIRVMSRDATISLACLIAYRLISSSPKGIQEAYRKSQQLQYGRYDQLAYHMHGPWSSWAALQTSTMTEIRNLWTCCSGS
jgi:hypothetical protein